MRQQFLSRVSADQSGCHLWMGGITVWGYGHFYWKGKYLRAHRVAWSLANGTIPEGLSILHSCDNRKCVNPEHLSLGTQKDNMRDRTDRGRGADFSGEKNPTAKLKVSDLAIIRKSSLSCSKLAKQYGVVKQTIANIRSGKSWKDF